MRTARASPDLERAGEGDPRGSWLDDRCSGRVRALSQLVLHHRRVDRLKSLVCSSPQGELNARAAQVDTGSGQVHHPA